MVVKGVLLDFDGTVVDSEISRWKSINTVLENYGVSISKKEWEEKYRSLGTEIILDELKEKYSLTYDSKQLYELSHSIREKIEETEGVPLIKGFRTFLEFLEKNSIPFYICSGGKSDHVKKILQMHQLEHLPSFGREEYTHRKPAPDAYLEGLKRLHLSSKEVIVFDDAKTGLESGKNAHCRIIGINTSEFEDLSDLELLGNFKDWEELDYSLLKK
jgi:glycerol 3-phosphatase-1